MKAEITENGMLVVTPENSTETFALSCWWDRYEKSTDKPTSLKVNLKDQFLLIHSVGKEIDSILKLHKNPSVS